MLHPPFVSQIVGMHGCAAAATFLLLSFSWPLCHMPFVFLWRTVL